MSFVRNSAYLAAANFALLIAAYFTNVWTGRFLGPADFGKYVTILGLFGIMNVLLTNGSSQAIAKVVAEDKRHSGLITAELLRLCAPLLIVLAAVFYFAAAPLLASLLNDTSLLPSIKLLTPIILVYGIGAIYAGYFLGTEQFGLQTIKLILISIGKVLLTVLLTLQFVVSGAISALSLSGVIGIIFSIVFIRVNPFRKAPVDAKQLVVRVIRLTIPMTTYLFLITLFMQLGVFITKTALGADVLTGYFGAAKGILQIPTTMFSAVGLVLLTTVSRTYVNKSVAETQNTLKEVFRYIMIALVPAVLFVSATPAYVINLIYGHNYLPGSDILSALNVGTGFFVLVSLLTMVLNGIGKPAVTVWIAALMTAAHVAISFLLLPRYGTEGIAASFVIANIIGAVVTVFYTYKHLGSFIDLKSFAKIFAVGLAVFFGLKAAPISSSVSLLVAWAVAGLVYIAALFVIREIRKEDFRHIKSFISRPASSKVGDIGMEK